MQIETIRIKYKVSIEVSQKDRSSETIVNAVLSEIFAVPSGPHIKYETLCSIDFYEGFFVCGTLCGTFRCC